MFGIFTKKPLLPVDGVVARIGPWFGPAEINGMVIQLESYAQPFIVLRDNQLASAAWLGLTQPGDVVRFMAKVREDEFTVSLSTFRNITLEGEPEAAQ